MEEGEGGKGLEGSNRLPMLILWLFSTLFPCCGFYALSGFSQKQVSSGQYGGNAVQFSWHHWSIAVSPSQIPVAENANRILF